MMQAAMFWLLLCYINPFSYILIYIDYLPRPKLTPCTSFKNKHSVVSTSSVACYDTQHALCAMHCDMQEKDANSHLTFTVTNIYSFANIRIQQVKSSQEPVKKNHLKRS
jgi:hypothetical protein